MFSPTSDFPTEATIYSLYQAFLILFSGENCLFHMENFSLLKLLFYKLLFVKTLHQCPPTLIQCIKFSFSLTAGARFRWINNKSIPHSSSVFAWRRGKNTCVPSIVYRLLIGTWSQGNLHYMRLHFLKLDREFFCLQPSLARLYSAAASPSERLRSDGSLTIINIV